MRLTDFLRRATWAGGGVAAAKLILGVSVPLPDAAVLSEFVQKSGNSMLRLYNLLGGGALARGSAFALGIMPYVSARLFMLLARHASPQVRTLSADTTKWWTRGLTVGISLIQSFGYTRLTQGMPGAVSQPGLAYTIQTMAMLTSVSALLMLFAEEATSTEESHDTPILPRENADVVRPAVRDRLYVSHPTPL